MKEQVTSAPMGWGRELKEIDTTLRLTSLVGQYVRGRDSGRSPWPWEAILLGYRVRRGEAWSVGSSPAVRCCPQGN